MSDKKNVKNNIDDNEKVEKIEKDVSEKTDKKSLSDEVKQRIAGLAVIGVITVGLCAMGIVGKFSGDSIPTASVSSSVSENESSAADDESSALDNSSFVSSVDDDSQKDESADTTTAEDSSRQDTYDSQSDETSADSEQSKADETQAPQPPNTDPPKTDPPKTDPPKTDPPKTDPPAPSGGLSASCSVTNSWETNGEKFCQIGITINNGTSSDKNGWTVTVTVPNGTGIDSSWNGNFSVNGSTITITPVDYNSTIPAGGSISDVGLIVKSPSEFTPTASVR